MIDDAGFELVRIRADTTVMLLPDLWMPTDRAHLDAFERPAQVADPDGLARGLRAAGVEVDGPHWDDDRWVGWLHVAMSDGRQMLLGTNLEPDEWPHAPR